MRNIPICTIILIIFLSFWHSGCEPGRATFPDHIMFNYTAQNRGELFPCGCRIPLGGLSRRAGVLAEQNGYPELTLSAGGFMGGNTGYDRFVGKFILEAYVRMGYDAVNIGYTETYLPVSALRELDSASEGMLISANLRDREDLPVTRKYLVRKVGGIDIGITGVTGTITYPESQRRGVSRDGTEMPILGDPVESLLEVMHEFSTANVDFVVLLADLNNVDVEKVLNEINGIDLIIQGQEFHPNVRAGTEKLGEGETLVVKIGGQGKYLGRLRLDFDEEGNLIGEEGQRIDLDSSVPTSSAITQLLLDFKTEVRDRRDEFLEDPTNPFRHSNVPELVDVLTGYAGHTYCNSCHMAYSLEKGYTIHQNAFFVLSEDDKKDPECAECHVTGFGVPTGYSDQYKHSHLKGVTCEACHGPASEHVIEQTAIKEDLDPDTMIEPENPTGVEFRKEVPEEICLRCHTEEWSPDFDYGTWVEKVNHSEVPDMEDLLGTGASGPVNIENLQNSEKIDPE